MTELTTDIEFKTLIYPVSDEEYSALDKDIFFNGCRHKIGIWNNIIIDGHKRYEICKRRELPLYTFDMAFNSRAEVVSWICKGQLSRTDLPEEMRKYLIGKYYEAEKELYIAQLKKQDINPKLRGYQYRIAGIIGKECNLVAGTIYKYGIYAKALDNVLSKNQAIVNKILSGRLRISHDNIIELSRLPRDEVCALDVSLSENNIERIGYSEMRHELQWQRLPSVPITKKKEVPSMPIKEIPEYDPDAELSSLTLTIPSWISSIERTKSTAELSKTSDLARSKLSKQLTFLKNAAMQMQEVLKENEKNG